MEQEQKKKINYWLIGGSLIILVIMGYFSFQDVENARNNGVYTIASVTKLRPAKNGWKVNTSIEYKNRFFQFDHLEVWESFSLRDSRKRFFAKIRMEDGECKLGFIYSKEEVPDSLQVAPTEGWSEEWMKEHFPEVVENVHDTR